MLINELPDDCLHAVFDYLNDLDDLINCYKVCIKWNQLIAERTKKNQRINESQIFSDYPDYSSDCVYYQKKDFIDVTCLSKLFPNLMIADVSNIFHCKSNSKIEDIVSFVRNHESLKGIINASKERIEKYCDKLEMLSSGRIEPSILRNHCSLKQLHTLNYYQDFKRDAHYFPNLERLHIYIKGGYYAGPVLEKLKILELCLLYPHGVCYVTFQLMDSCPNLQSAHIFTPTNRFFVDETLKHKCLQDLVMSYGGPSCLDWNDLTRLFMKYPNLKHLSLRNVRYIKDEHIEQLVQILPNLVLFDIYDCPAVTQRAADYVEDYCKRYGRLIKFYFEGNYHEIGTDWPQLSTKREKISRGFDFMKNCFLKDFHHLPCFLIPEDY
uniref:F-box domain-containing protein n=1 Tax=Tetranychus urticae TaxID=32264 RepID=T1L6H9_TETUR